MQQRQTNKKLIDYTKLGKFAPIQCNCGNTNFSQSNGFSLIFICTKCGNVYK